MVTFGLISYGIYLWHTIVADEVHKSVTRGDMPSGILAGATVMLSVTVVVAGISYFVVEKPLISFSRRISARHR